MKDANQDLITYLATERNIRPALLLAFTLSDGSIYRFASSDVRTLKADGFQWSGGMPTFSVSGLRRTVGIEASSVTINANFRADTQLGASPWASVLARGALDGAYVVIRRGYWRDWSSAAVGTLHVFEGSVDDVSGGFPSLRIVLRDEVDRLNVAIPRTVYQAGCRNTLYQPRCGVQRVDVTCSARAGSTRSRIAAVGLSQADGWFTGGLVRGSTGANAGAVRGVKSHSGGVLIVSEPWASAPAAGDVFLVAAGCDRQRSTCETKFNNGLNFRAEFFIPTPETAL